MRNHNSSAQREHHYGKLEPMGEEPKLWQGPYWLYAFAAFAFVLIAGMSA